MSEVSPPDPASLPEEDQGLPQSDLPAPPGRKWRSIFAGRSWRDVFGPALWRDVFEKTKHELSSCTPEGGPHYWDHDEVDTDEEPPWRPKWWMETKYTGRKCRRCGQFIYTSKGGE